LIDEGNNFVSMVTSLTQKYVELKERAFQIDVEAKKKLEAFGSSLDLKLKDRDKDLSAFEKEKQEKISEIESIRIKLEELYSQIKNIIHISNGNCLQEAKELLSWSLNDNQSELFSRPIQWIYMPLYVMFIENKDTMEERMELILPGIVTNDPNNIYQEISDTMVNFKKTFIERIEEDMALRSNFEFSSGALRSNFEFSSGNKNFIDDKSLVKKIQQGISILRSHAIINDEIEKTIRSNLNLILKS
jgi:hypothetical protein